MTLLDLRRPDVRRRPGMRVPGDGIARAAGLSLGS